MTTTMTHTHFEESSSEPTTDSCRQFNMKSFVVSYDNRYSVRTVNQASTNNNLVINNYLCQRVGDKVLKKTEIRIGHQIILLEDSYSFDAIQPLKSLSFKLDLESETNASTSSPKMDQESSSQNEKLQDKSNKKNVVKNIVKSFENWLGSQAASEQFGESCSLHNIRKCLHRMITKIKFNNRLVNSMVENQNIHGLFEQFLSTEARSWLEQSKIKDRTSHMEAIELYLRSCSTHTLLVSRAKASHHGDSDI